MIAAAQQPADLSDEEAATYAVASALAGGKQLPESTHRRAVNHFGEDLTAELVYLLGGYCLVSVLLNAHDMGVPVREQGLPDEQGRLDPGCPRGQPGRRLGDHRHDDRGEQSGETPPS